MFCISKDVVSLARTNLFPPKNLFILGWLKMAIDNKFVSETLAMKKRQLQGGSGYSSVLIFFANLSFFSFNEGR